MTINRTLCLNSKGKNWRMFASMTLRFSASLAACRTHFCDKLHEMFELYNSLFDRELQVLPQQRPVHILLVSFNHGVAVIGRRQVIGGGPCPCMFRQVW